MSEQIPLPSDVRPRFRKWVYGCLAAIIAAIGIEPTMKAVEAGLAYYRANPLPAKEAPATNAPPVVVTNAPAPLPLPPAEITGDAIPAASIRIIGKHKMDPTRARVVAKMHSASISGGHVTVRHDPVNWRVGVKQPGCDGGFVIVWADGGGYVGGFFDHSKVGQTRKTLKNIPAGYIGAVPASGAPVWFYKIAADGTQRTTICAGGRWP